MENYIIIAVLILLVVGIVVYIAKAKKNSQGCIGCPYSKQCENRCKNKGAR